MLGYYLDLALHSLSRNVALTLLTIVAVAVGIGASMTVFTMLHGLSSDPIPEKSSQLFVPLIDNWGMFENFDSSLWTQLSYSDAMALTRAAHARRQSAMYAIHSSVIPSNADVKPFSATGRAVSKDFFEMFNVGFATGGAWSSADDEDRANVVVLSSRLADKVFAGQGSVGKTISLDDQDYRVVGVIKRWDPLPRFYDLSGSRTEDFFIPFSTAIARQIPSAGGNMCLHEPAPGWLGHLNSECTWVGFWVELPTPNDVQSFKAYLHAYAEDQQRLGRFHWAPHVALYDVREWLKREKVVPDEVRVASFVAFGFLLVCILNAVALMLAKFSNRANEFSVRCALGASKADIFGQCIAETALVGAAGGLLGLALTALGLRAERSIVNEDLARLTHLDYGMVFLTLTLAVLATVSSGLYPTWRASRVQPAAHLRAR